MIGRLLNGVKQPILFSFVLDKRSGYEVFRQPVTEQKKNKIVLNTITFY